MYTQDDLERFRKAKPKHVQMIVDEKDGEIRNVYFYYRKTKQKLLGVPGTPEFVRSYNQATRGIRPKKPKKQRTVTDIDALIHEYQCSPNYRRLAPYHKIKKDAYLRTISHKFRRAKLEDFNSRKIREVIYRLRDEYLATPAQADQVIGTLRTLLSFAVDRGKIDVNHALKIEKVYGGGNRNNIIFTDEVILKLIEVAYPDEGLALLFSLFTGMRLKDQCDLKESAWDGQWIAYIPEKTANSSGTTVSLPTFAFPPLQRILDARTALNGETLIGAIDRTPHTRNRPQPFTHWALRKRFQDMKERAGLKDMDLHWHDLRGTCVSRLYDAGCTDAEVSAISGHAIASGSQLSAYISNNRDRAVTAYQKWYKHMVHTACPLLNLFDPDPTDPDCKTGVKWLQNPMETGTSQLRGKTKKFRVSAAFKGTFYTVFYRKSHRRL